MEALTAIATRKSVRAFLPEQISTDDLNTILGAGSSAPVALGDYGNVHFTVIQKKEMLVQLGGRKSPFYDAPTLVLISAKKTHYPNIEFFNVGCILENMFLAATTLGLGSVFISSASEVAQSDPKLLAALDLPRHFFPVAAVVLGYSKEPIKETTAFKNKVKVNRIV
jgi:Nitroreductase